MKTILLASSGWVRAAAAIAGLILSFAPLMFCFVCAALFLSPRVQSDFSISK